eukprot:scaffold40269_cov28-Attheya_sp.AAC.1
MQLLLDGRLTNASCNIENMSSPPGSARTMLRSSPSNLCQEVRDAWVRFRENSSCKMVSRRSIRCGGSSMVPAMVSMSQTCSSRPQMGQIENSPP